MKTILILSIIFVGAFCTTPLYQQQLMKDLFSQWKLAHNKNYKGGFEEDHRFAIFISNYNKITEINQAQSDVVLGLNKFADLTDEEFSMAYTGYTPGKMSNATTANLSLEYPTRHDWRSFGAVTPVRDQGLCGSCWAFCSVGALEALNFFQSGNLVSFSEQYLVDCDPLNDGCGGGWMAYAYDYVRDNGIPLLENYPYAGINQLCYSDPSQNYNVNTGYTRVTPKDVGALKTAIVKNPVAVAVQGTQTVFKFYKSGTITSSCGPNIDHAVLAVGYDTSYFIVKNSWGTGWGINGYAQIGTSTTVNSGNGVCGILRENVYPTFNLRSE